MIIFSKRRCPYCVKVKIFFEQNKVTTYKNIELDKIKDGLKY